MIKILVVGMSGILGGVEKEVLSIINYAPTDYKFDFLCFGKNFSYENEYPEIKFYYLPRRKKSYFKSQRAQKDFWKKYGSNYDWIWINTSSASNISIHKFAKRYSDARIITHSHGSKIEHSSKALGFVHNVLHVINRKLLVSYSDKLVACSINASKHLFGVASKRATIIYNGIEIEKYRFSNNDRILLRQKLGISENAIVMLCLGRLEAVKHFAYAIEIIKELQNKNGYNYLLMIVGDGSQRSYLEEYARNGKVQNVVFTGYQKQIKSYLDASDIMLQPSLFEGFPVSAIEAQANGLFCILSDRITKEVKATNNISFLPIDDKKLNEWVKQVVGFNKGIDRLEANNMLYKAGFDVAESAKAFFRTINTIGVSGIENDGL